MEGLQAHLALGGFRQELRGGFRALAVEDDDLLAGLQAQDVERVVRLALVEREGVGVPGGGRDVEAVHDKETLLAAEHGNESLRRDARLP